MRVLDLSFPSPKENILFDDVLWQRAEKNEAGEALRFWESPRVFIVLGRISDQERDVNSVLAQANEVPVLRRSSGGGTVVQGPGCLNYTLVLSKQKYPVLNDLHQSYEWISQRVIKALQALGIDAYFRPTSDLALGDDERKFSGNAQRRGKGYVLHHGTILYGFDLGLIDQYLNYPKDVPDYRHGRAHKDFVINIPLNPGVFKENLARQFSVRDSPQPATPEELLSLRLLVASAKDVEII